MQHIEQEIKNAFQDFCTDNIKSVQKIPQSGSDRIYFRIITNQKSYIALYSNHIKENNTFIYFTKHFIEKKIPVPNIYFINKDRNIYIQEDLGNTSLLDILETDGKTENVFNLFKKTLQQLALMQVLGHQGLDYSTCLTNQQFGKEAILSDLLYFKYYFLDTLQYPYNKQKLLHDFENISIYLSQSTYNYFLFRDFQSRNIMIKNNEPFFIDYQGGMCGALQYDIASLLWQAKAALSKDWKENLFNFYLNEIDNILPKKVDKIIFKNQYIGYVLIRLLQVLGAYGFRGLFERKAHFLASIPFALLNLKEYLQNNTFDISIPTLENILNFIISNETIQKFTIKQADENTPLEIEVNSFSFRNGIPEDNSENGGGFVFDMRGIFNPGRFDEYKKLTGLDKSVQDFLENKTKMNTFLNSAWDTLDISIENYMERGFKKLQINFGCTGGQHRSVYAAEQTARHLKNKYKLKVKLNHTNKNNWLN